MYKHAVILCGGKGSRLIPYTQSVPKALLPLGGYPILEIIIRQLKFYGFNHITLSTGHMADKIMNFVGNGSKWGVQINYSSEDAPLGTAGPLKILSGLPDDILIINGDILTSLNFEALFTYHLAKHSLFTIAAFNKPCQVDYGVLDIDAFSCITGMSEKSKILLVNAGIYAANKKVLGLIPSKQFFGIDLLIQKIIHDCLEIYAFPFDGCWQDIGTVKEYESALETFKAADYIPGEK